MISGTYVLTDSIDQAFDRIFNEIRAARTPYHRQVGVRLREGSGVTAPTFDESLLAGGAGAAGVRRPRGRRLGETQLIDDEGDAIVYGGAPNLGFSIGDPESPFNPLTLVEGEWPGRDEVVVDRETVSKEDFEVGDTIGVQAEGRSSGSGSPGSSSSAPVSLSAARRSPDSTFPRRNG